MPVQWVVFVEVVSLRVEHLILSYEITSVQLSPRDGRESQQTRMARSRNHLFQWDIPPSVAVVGVCEASVVIVKSAEVTDDQLGIIGFSQLDQPAERRLRHPIVAIDEGDIFAPCGSYAKVARHTGSTESSVVQLDGSNSIIECPMHFDDLPTIVSGCIVYNDQLEVFEILHQNGLNGCIQVRCNVEHRHNDRQERCPIRAGQLRLFDDV